MAKENINNDNVNDTVTQVAPVNTDVNVPTDTSDKEQDKKEALKTAKELKKATVRIKIPVDPLNPKDLVVPVMINGYIWEIKRGETVDVPEEVANILENAKYI